MGNKILFIINRMTYGGAGKMMAFLVNKLSCEGYDIHILTYENNEVAPLLDPKVHHIDFHYSPPSVVAIRRFFQIVQVRKVINQIKPAVIISFLTYPNTISIIASLGTRIPVIVSERGDPYCENGWFSIIKDFIYNYADGYVFQTTAAKNYYNKSIQRKAVIIPNPVITEEVPSKWMEKREDIIVNVGRLELKQKRQDLLIYAFKKISDEFQNIKLVIFGDGEDDFKIRRIITDYGLEDRVVLAGVTKNVYESIKKARMFVLSSNYEGMPNALIEAMSVGLPCVSTDCSPGGAAELIKNMENGVLVKPGCIDELANAMEFMLNNPEKAEIMGQNAMKIKYDLDPEVIIHQWKNHINHCKMAKSLHK